MLDGIPLKSQGSGVGVGAGAEVEVGVGSKGLGTDKLQPQHLGSYNAVEGEVHEIC